MGGTFTAYNKIQPGAYINFENVPKPLLTIGARGVATMPVVSDWGEENKIIELTPMDMINGNFFKLLGTQNRLILELMLSGCSKALIYRVNSGTEATATLGELTVTAKYSGDMGNAIAVAIVNNNVITSFDGLGVLEVQTVDDYNELEDNDYVVFSGTGVPTETAATRLQGGINGIADYSGYFKAMQTAKWQVMAIPTDDSTAKSNAMTLVRKMREDDGIKVQVALVSADANYEGIIKVKQELKLNDTKITASQLTAYVAGISAGAEITQSNTARRTPFTSIVDEMTNTEIDKALTSGFFVFGSMADGGVKVVQDINSLTDFTATKGKMFSKNKIIRIIDEIGNTVSSTFEKYYMGKVNNNEIGRDAFKGDILSYINSLVAIQVLQNFTPKDITVTQGVEKDEIIATLGIEPVDAVEKLYLTVKLR